MKDYQAAKKRRLNSEFSVLTITEDDNSIIEISSEDSQDDDKVNENRELSPADSGFKEPSTSTSNTKPQLDSQRLSNRIKEQQEIEAKFTPTERLLRHFLKTKNLIQPLESEMKNLNPILKVRKLTKYQTTMIVSLERFVPKLPEFPSEFEFQGIILHSWRNYDDQHLHYFVRWLPLNILNDEWMIADYAKITRLKKKVKLSELSMKQRRIICERIFKEN